MLFCCILSKATVYHYQPYGASKTETFTCIAPGDNHYFEVDKIASYKNTKWYLNGTYTGVSQNSGLFATDPDMTFSINSDCTIKALIYNNDWTILEETHIWIFTVSTTPSSFLFFVQQDACHKAVLDWTTSDGATGYKINRDGTTIVDLSANVTSYTDNSVGEGTYNYCIYAYNSCMQRYACLNVDVKDVPLAPTGVLASDGTYCDKVFISWNSVSGATSYDVYRSSTFLTNTSSSSYYDYNASTSSTTYKVYAKNSCGNSSSYGINSGYIKLSSTAPSGASANPNPVCPGYSATLTESGGSLGTGASWKWYSGSCGGTYVGSGSSISVSPSSTTTYYVRAEGDCNITSCASVTVTITSKPGQATISGNNPVCSGNTEIYMASSTGATSYNWTVP